MKFYDKQGNEILIEFWMQMLADDEYRVVGQHEAGGVLVSTVWLGLDHSFGGEVSKIFETMVFSKGMQEDVCRRYATLAEALRGHIETVHATLGLIAEIDEVK